MPPSGVLHAIRFILELYEVQSHFPHAHAASRVAFIRAASMRRLKYCELRGANWLAGSSDLADIFERPQMIVNLGGKTSPRVFLAAWQLLYTTACNSGPLPRGERNMKLRRSHYSLQKGTTGSIACFDLVHWRMLDLLLAIELGDKESVTLMASFG